MRRVVLSLAVVLAFAGVARGQNTGQIFGKVTDSSGGVLPGATVTLASPSLLEPIVAVTSETGSYQFPRLGIGVYSVKVELAGFRSLIKNEIRLEIGFNAQINAQLEIAGLEQSVQVVGSSPVVDLRSASQGSEMSLEALQTIPSSRDIFHIVEQAPGVAVDRQNVGGSTSGQQTSFISRGAQQNQTKWIIDGIEVSDTGNGSAYYTDFDAFEEMSISTGGGDVTQQTPGAQINIVTKSGSDVFRTSGRTYITDKRLAATNMTDEFRRGGATAGNPLINFKDYGIDVSGPIKKSRLWFWFAYGAQDQQVGVVNFYQKTSECAPVAANPLGHSEAQVRDCLGIAPTSQDHINYKITGQPFKGNQVTVRMGFDRKLEKYRGANDVVAPEAADNIYPTMEKRFGVIGWNRGWPNTHKFADQHTFSDRWLMELAVTHFNKDTTLTFDTPDLATVQQAREISSGNIARSGSHTAKTLPYDTFYVSTNYFLPGKLGGDHTIKAGFRYGRNRLYSEGPRMGGGVMARFNSAANLPRFTTPFSAQFYRENVSEEKWYQRSAYFQDTYSTGKLTVNLGLRWDRQNDRLSAVDVPGSQFQGQRDINGVLFNLLPAVSFPGAEGGVVWNTFAPRLSATYDLTGDGKTAVRASYAQYYNQRDLAELARTYNTIGASYVELPWQDLNGDKFVQANEVDTKQVLSYGGQYNPADPAQTVSPNKVDPNIHDPRTDEFVAGVSRELAANFGVSVSYIWRKYTRLPWQQKIGLSSSDYSPVTYTPPASACPAGARCETVTYYVPNISVPAPYIYTDQPDYYKKYGGMEVVLRKRMSKRWMMTASFSYNDTKAFYTSPASYQDPTNIDMYNGAQFAPESAGSTGAVGNSIFVNAKWMTRFSGSYRLPWNEIGLAASYDMRQGYPFLPSINIASRPNRAGAIAVLLDPVGDVRLPTFRTLDFRVDKSLTFGKLKMVPAFDIFNVFNGNMIMGRRRNQNASNANMVNVTLSPRIARFGVSVTF